MNRETWGAAGNYRSDFDLIAVVEHFILCDELVALNHQMCFDDEIQLPQEVLGLLRAFDLDGSRGMA